MHKSTLLALTFATFGLAACGTTETQRGVSGAAIGAVTAGVIGANVVIGATVGAAAGVFCDDISPGLCN